MPALDLDVELPPVGPLVAVLDQAAIQPSEALVARARGAGEAGNPQLLRENAEAAVLFFEARLQGKPARSEAARLEYETGRLYEWPLGELARAHQHYQAALSLAPDHLPTIRGARRVLLAQGQHLPAVALYDAELRLTTDVKLRAVLLCQKAQLLEDHLNQQNDARDAYRAAGELAGLDARVLEALVRAETRAAAWDAVDRAYQGLTSLLSEDPVHRAALFVERARLVEQRKRDPALAAELYQAALELDAWAPTALTSLKRLQYEGARHHDRIATLKREVSQLSENESKASALLEIARIEWWQLGDLPAALSSLQAAHQQDPKDVIVLEELARGYQVSERFAELVGVLEKLQALSASTAVRVGYLTEMGELLEGRLGDAEAALSCFQRALGIDATFRPALLGLERLYERLGRWEALVAMLLGEAEASSDVVRRADCHLRAAFIFELRLGKPEEAIAQLRRVLALAPAHTGAFDAQVRLLEQARRFREVVELYEARIDAGDEETKVTFLFKVGRLHEDALSQPEQAMLAYGRVLGLRPNHAEARHAFQRTAERAQRFDELVRSLRDEAEATLELRPKLQLLHRAGELSIERLHDETSGLELFRKVLELDGGYLPVLASLARVHERRGRWLELLEVYRAELKVTQKGPAAAALWFKIGQALAQVPGKEPEALSAYRSAVEADPAHRRAAQALTAGLKGAGQWPELVRRLEAELLATEEQKQQAYLAFELGQVLEHRLSQPEKALLAYERALVARPGFAGAVEGRLRLLLQANNPKRLVEALEERAQESPDPKVRVSSLLLAGGVYSGELKNPKEAAARFEAVLALEPRHLGAILALEQLYAGLGDVANLARIRALEAGTTRDENARVAALSELGRLQELAGAEEAKQTYLAVLERLPGDLASLLALERLAIERSDTGLLLDVDARRARLDGDPELLALHFTRLGEAAEAAGEACALDCFRIALRASPTNLTAAKGLSRVARRAKEPQLLEEAAETESRVTLDLDAAAELLVEAAQLRVGRGEVALAQRALQRALEIHPDDSASASAIAELLRASASEQLILVLTQAARGARSQKRRAQLWTEVAQLLANARGDTGAAISALKRVLAEGEPEPGVLLGLAELHLRDRNWAEASSRLDEVLRTNPPPELALRAELHRALVLIEHSEHPAKAMTSLHFVLRLEPEHIEALRLRLLLEARLGQLDAAMATAQKLLSLPLPASTRADVLSLTAGLEKRRGNVEEALSYYAEAVALVGRHGEASAYFKELLVEARKPPERPAWPRYLGALKRFVDAQPPPEEGTKAYLELARILGDELGEAEQSLLALRSGLHGDPTSVELRKELAVRLKRQQALEPALTEFRHLLDLDSGDRETWRHLAECFAGLGRHAEAVLAMAPLAYLGAANDLERASLQARAARPATGAAGALSVPVLAALDSGAAQEPATQLMQALAEMASKLYAPQLPLGSKERLGPRSGHPLRALADRIGVLLGFEDFEIYLPSDYTGSATLELTDPVSLVLPVSFEGWSEAERCFVLGWLMVLASRKLHPIVKLGPADLELLLAAGARAAEPEFGAGMFDEEELGVLARKVQKAVSWGRRRALDDAAGAYARSGGQKIALWRTHIELGAARAALLMADDLPAALGSVERLPIPEVGLRAESVRADLLRFWISETASSLRRRMGVL